MRNQAVTPLKRVCKSKNNSPLLLLLAHWFLLAIFPLTQATGQISSYKTQGSKISGTLVHYWNFNDNSTLTDLLTPTLSLVPQGTIIEVPGGSSYINVAGGTGQGFEISNHNGRLGDTAGTHLRFDNPIGGELIFHLPTIGFTDPVVRFAMRRSGQGAGLQHWEYATDSAQTFIPFQTLVPIDGNPMLVTLDFTGITTTNDNPYFSVKATFSQGAGGTAGNNRFDNFTLDATPITQTPLIGASFDTMPHFSHFVGTPSAHTTLNITGINLTGDIEVLAPATFEVSSGAGFTHGVIIPQSAGTVPMQPILVRLNAPVAGSFHGDLIITSPGADTVRVAVSGVSMPIPAPLDLIIYWHFNTLNTSQGDVKTIDADYHTLPGTLPTMNYTGGKPGERDMDAYSTGTSLNLHQMATSGQAARVRNPSNNRSLMFSLPTTNHTDIRFTYAVHRSNNGQLTHEIEYSTDGVNYTQTGMPQTTFHVADTYALVLVDFSGISAANDNPNFHIRINFVGNTGGNSGNNRFDNIALEGNMISGMEDHAATHKLPLAVFPNPLSPSQTLHLNKSSTFVIYDLQGRIITTGMNTRYIPMSNLLSGIYVLRTVQGESVKIILH
jgi:hypothetical protein